MIVRWCVPMLDVAGIEQHWCFLPIRRKRFPFRARSGQRRERLPMPQPAVAASRRDTRRAPTSTRIKSTARIISTINTDA